MKIIDKNDEVNLHPDVKENLDFFASKTPFLMSVIFLIVEVISLFLCLFLLTSPDIKMSYKIDIGAGMGFNILFLGLVFLLTFIGFMLNFHGSDQFSYNIGLAGMLFTFYMTSYWWSWDQVLYRCLVSFLALIIFVLIGAFANIMMRNFKFYLQERKAEKQKKTSQPD